MTTPMPVQESILTLTTRFGEIFNGGDLDAVIAQFSEDAIYVGFEGHVSRGRSAIREAFTPLFRGDYGKVKFHTEEVLVDETSARATVRWLCHHQIPDLQGPTPVSRLRRAFYRGLYGRNFGWHGLDVLRFKGGLVCEKRTYTFARMPLTQRNPTLP